MLQPLTLGPRRSSVQGLAEALTGTSRDGLDLLVGRHCSQTGWSNGTREVGELVIDAQDIRFFLKKLGASK